MIRYKGRSMLAIHSWLRVNERKNEVKGPNMAWAISTGIVMAQSIMLDIVDIVDVSVGRSPNFHS